MILSLLRSSLQTLATEQANELKELTFSMLQETEKLREHQSSEFARCAADLGAFHLQFVQHDTCSRQLCWGVS